MSIGKVHMSDGALLLLSLCFLCDTENVLPIFLFAALVHEFGHLLTLWGFGGKLHRVQLCGCGAVIHCDMPPKTYQKVLVCAAGPIASFVLYLGGYLCGAPLLAGASLLLGLFNLMPIPPLDGGMILWHAFGLMHAEGLKIIALVAAGGLLATAAALWACGFGMWLFVISISVFVQTMKRVAKYDTSVYNGVGHTI